MSRRTEAYLTENIIVDKMIPGGQALGALSNGKKILMWNALPGEIVSECLVTKEKANYIEAIATRITTSSAHRIAPQDSCYLSTSPWQILDYQYELTQKYQLLLEIFRQQQIATDVLEILPVQTDGRDFHYRNKMEYALYYNHDDQLIYPAFRARGTHRKIPVTQSSLEHAVIWRHAQSIIQELNATGADARQYQSLILRCGQSGQVSGGLLENGKTHPCFSQLQDQILEHQYRYSPNGFFQINLPVYEMALKEIQKYVHSDAVLDLYAGVGTIGLSVARTRQLTLVECDKSAYRELEHNCQGTSAHPILAKSEAALDYLAPTQTVILDPPRAGCYPEVIARIATVLPHTVIYLSCNPITQARDVAKLLHLYHIRRVIPFNFFPRTPHLENLIILERK